MVTFYLYVLMYSRKNSGPEVRGTSVLVPTSMTKYVVFFGSSRNTYGLQFPHLKMRDLDEVSECQIVV